MKNPEFKSENPCPFPEAVAAGGNMKHNSVLHQDGRRKRKYERLKITPLSISARSLSLCGTAWKEFEEMQSQLP